MPDPEKVPRSGAPASPELQPAAEAAAVDEADRLSVFWENDQDPQNPKNWPPRRRWGSIAILSFLTLLTPLASSMLAPGVPQVMADLGGTDDSLATFVISIFVLGFAIGPLLMAPLSELYGRAVVYNTTNVLSVIFTAACGLSTSMGMLAGFRFFAGLSGSAVICNGSGTIADLMPPEDRGKAMALWAFGPLIGPIIGPICAGFLVEAAGWRWVFWVITIAFGVATTISFFLLRETYGPYILESKAAKLRKETGNPGYHSRLRKKGTPRELMLAAVIRPTRMLLRAPVVTAMCFYTAVLYAIVYILFSTFAFVFHDVYGFGPSAAGLTYAAMGVGEIISLGFTGALSDRKVKAKQAAGVEPEPEDRLALYITVPSAILFSVGLFTYGWTADKHVHWIAPMVGTGLVGFGLVVLFMTVSVYLVDSYPVHAASGMAANTFVRGLLGALLPLSALQLYERLGLGWGNTLLGLVAVAMAPIPVLFERYGKRIRTSKRFTSEF